MAVFHQKEQAAAYMNYLGQESTPFVFLINYDQSEIHIHEEGSTPFAYDMNGHVGGPQPLREQSELTFSAEPLDYEDYLRKYKIVQDALHRGDSYLINLTTATPVSSSWSLADIYAATSAKYRVHLPNRFTCFSPETFVTIDDGVLSSYPMKGTIDASIPEASETILNDQKEAAEHATMVDLIRNDLSIVSDQVWVERYRYITEVLGHDKSLLQVSSQISAQLEDDYATRIGDILFALLPAGSITGAPKAKTLEIIQQAEERDRGFYTGICGRFDGVNLDSGVMIRMITDDDGQLHYHSGGGITYHSTPESEYREMIQKIYVPISRDHTDQERRDTQSALSQRAPESV